MRICFTSFYFLFDFVFLDNAHAHRATRPRGLKKIGDVPSPPKNNVPVQVVAYDCCAVSVVVAVVIAKLVEPLHSVLPSSSSSLVSLDSALVPEP